jgi:hypothetical protein
LTAIPTYNASEVTKSIIDEVERSFRVNAPLIVNKNIWMILPSKKQKFAA